jgi:DNA-binding HxlR family transcriptional regulator
LRVDEWKKLNADIDEVSGKLDAIRAERRADVRESERLARNKRAVRAGPGTASDRRDTVGRGGDPAVSNSNRSSLAPDPDFKGHLPGREPARNGLSGGIALRPTVGTQPVPRSLSRSAAFKQGLDEPGTSAESVFWLGEQVSLLHELNRHCGTLEILRLLNDEGPATKYAMTRSLHPAPSGIKSSVRCLEWLGLIERVPGDSVSKPYHLTEQGKALVSQPLNAWPLWLAIQSQGGRIQTLNHP